MLPHRIGKMPVWLCRPKGGIAERLLALGLGLLSPALADAQGNAGALPAEKTYKTSVIGVEAGLPSDVASAVLQTRDGYLWIATEDGLCRFDGIRITTFRTTNTPGIQSNLIRCFLEDDSGILWIGTQQGLSSYRDGKFEAIAGINVPVTDLACDREGRLWIATLGAGLLDLEGGRLVSHMGEPGLPASPRVIRLLCDSAGRTWIAFRGSGLASYYRGKFQAEKWADAIPGEVVRMTEAPKGTLWIGTVHGAWRRAGDGLPMHVGAQQGLPDDEPVSDFLTDAEGHFWVVARGLYRAETTRAETFTQVPVEWSNFCRSISEDREGNYWVATSGVGIERLRPSAFRLIFPVRGEMRSISLGAGNVVWAALGSQGIVPVGPGGELPTVPLGGAEKRDTQSLFADSGGRLWIGGGRSDFGVWDGKKFTRYPMPATVTCMFEDSKGTMWFGPYGHGVMRYSNGVLESMAGMIGGPTDTVTCFAEDRAGTLYVGMDEGLYAVRGGVASRMDPKGAVPNLVVRAVLPDAGGTLWIGTKGNGLVLFENGRWYGQEGLSDPIGDVVSTLVDDNFGNLWLGTPRGIAWAKKKNLREIAHGQSPTDRFHFAGQNEVASWSSAVRSVGSTVGSGSQPSTSRMPDGSIWFVTRLGIVSANPAGISTNTVVPPVYIERVRVDGIDVGNSGLVTLPAGARSVAIDYTAVSFVQPGAVNFRYQLVGHDRDWIEAGDRRTAFYTDLKPGQYRFRVIASNNNGVWNETGASLDIRQRAWFYETWWFYACVVAAAIGTAWAVNRRHTALLRMENDRLEGGIAERTRELRRSEEALRASQETMSKAFHTLPDAVSINRVSDGKFLEINAGFTEMTGYSAAEVVAPDPSFIAERMWAGPSDRDRFLALISEHGEVRGFEASFRRKDGTVYEGSLSARSMEIRGESCLLAILRDVTDQKQTEEQLRHAQKMEAVGQLAGGVAHDFNNILTSTLMQLGLLLEGREHSAATRAALKELEKDANRATSLTRQLLTFSSRQTMSTSAIDLNTTLVNLFSMLRRLLGEHIYFEFKRSPAPITIEADAGMIEQVVTNLCVNARDAMTPKGGRLVVETSLRALRASDVAGNPDGRSGLFACLSVSDTGTGMSPEALGHLFEPFYTTKELGRGTGLGLAMAYGIARQHRGWIEVSSEVGRGSTFRVFLPALEAQPLQKAQPPLAQSQGGRETILLVEDEEAVRMTVYHVLTRSGYRVLQAGDGEEATRIWEERSGEIDLLFSDMLMPKGITGLDLAARFRRTHPGLRVLVTSGYSLDLSSGGVQLDAATAFLAKPFELAALIAKVRACLDSAPVAMQGGAG
jgi:PAS domain S-box-containing protein